MAVNFIETILAILVPATLAEKDQAHVPRVVLGQSAAKDQYPYVVSLETLTPKGDIALHRICTGSLVTNQWVLTAAHCLIDDVHVIRYGDMTMRHNETTCYKKVLKMVPHPGYLMIDLNDLEFGSNDIGMVLVEKLQIDTYARVSAEDYKSLSGRSVTFAGFGFTVEKDLGKEELDDFYVEQLLQDARRPLQIGEGVLNTRKSIYMIKPMLYVSPKCDNMRQTPNYGDSGGPMFYRDKIIAVCSGGYLYNPKSRPEMYGAYTPVSPFIQWIHDVVSFHP